MAVDAVGSGEIAVDIVEIGLHHGKPASTDAPHLLGEAGVGVGVSLQDDSLGTQANGLPNRHLDRKAESPRLVGTGGDNSSANDDGTAAKVGVLQLLDGGEERVEIKMQDRGAHGRQP